MKVLIVGACGFLGRAVHHVLQGLCEVVPASRRPRGPNWRRLDLGDRASFQVVDDVDGVINCADSIDASGVPLAQHCLRQGRFFLDPTHSTERVDEYLALRRASASSAIGRIVVGCGLFPGLSNVMARDVTERLPRAAEINVGVCVGVLAGGGRSMCRQMTHHLCVPTFWYQDDVRRVAPGIVSGPNMPSLQRGGYTVRVPFCETEMLRQTLDCPSVSTNLALRPAPLTGLLRWLSVGARRVPGVRFVLDHGAIAIRGCALAWKPASVSIAVTARLGAQAVGVHAHCKDGVKAAAAILAHTARNMPSLADRRSSGVYLLDELFTLSELLDGMVAANSSAGWNNPIAIRRW